MGGVRVGRLQEEGLDIGKERSVSRKNTRDQRVFQRRFPEILLLVSSFTHEIVHPSVCLILTLAATSQSAPFPCLCLWRCLSAPRAHAAATLNGILGCASASRGESHRPACAAIRL